MSDQNNDIMNYAAMVHGSQNQEAATEIVPSQTGETESQLPQASAEIAAEQTPVPESTTQAVTEPVAAEPDITQSNQVDFWKLIDERSQGLVKDEETFTSFVQRAKDYESIVKTKEELENNQFKPANSYIETLNKMVLDGATSEQINAFAKLNQYGEIKDLSPLDAKVTKMVLVDGYSESVARKLVEREFGGEEYDEDSDDKLILQEKLRVSSEADKKTLEAYKKDLTTIINPEKEASEKARLEEIANTEAYNKALKSQAPVLAQHFPQKVSYDLSDGEEKVSFEHSFADDFKNKMPSMVEAYFENTREPINPQTAQEAYEYAFASYLLENHQKVVQDVWNKASSYYAEKYSNKYENRTGLPQEAEVTRQQEMSQGQMSAFLKNIGAI